MFNQRRRMEEARKNVLLGAVIGSAATGIGMLANNKKVKRMIREEALKAKETSKNLYGKAHTQWETFQKKRSEKKDAKMNATDTPVGVNKDTSLVEEKEAKPYLNGKEAAKK